MLTRFVCAAVCVTSLALATATVASALPPPAGAPMTEPSANTTPVTKPLFYLGASHLAAELNAGTLSETQAQSQASAQGIAFITCYVNFTHTRNNTSTYSYFRWAAGVGCTAALQMWGEAYLVVNASTYLQDGPYYSGTMASANSGGQLTFYGFPSVYIYHGMNLRLQPSQQDNTVVGVLPQPGTDLNGASNCYQTGSNQYGSTGAHCDLYSNRF